MARKGLKALEFYTPETKKWGQAHMQGRYAIMRVLLLEGDGVLRIQQDKDNAVVVLDKSKILTSGSRAIGEFLKKLQVYKATANVQEGTEFYTNYTMVPEEYSELRNIVLAKRKPRKVFVQPHTSVNSSKTDVHYHEFPATPEGIIQSFVARFGGDV